MFARIWSVKYLEEYEMMNIQRNWCYVSDEFEALFCALRTPPLRSWIQKVLFRFELIKGRNWWKLFGNGHSEKGVAFFMDNARYYVCLYSLQNLIQFGFNLLLHLWHSPDLAPLDGHLFQSLLNYLKAKKSLLWKPLRAT